MQNTKVPDERHRVQGAWKRVKERREEEENG
jgi:hypothetical protein